MQLCHRRYFQNFGGSVFGSVNRQGLHSLKKALDLIKRDTLPPVRRDETVAYLIKPQHRNDSAALRKARENGEGVFPIRLVIQEPPQRE